MSDPAYWLAVAFGFVVVLLVSIENFDTPSYRKLEKIIFKKYRPRFVTFDRLYLRALVLYLAFVELIYAGFVLSAGFGYAIAGGGDGDRPDFGSPAHPLFAASVIVGFQHGFWIKEVERRIRHWLHRWAKIPHGARSTIGDLWRSRFTFDAYRDLEVLRAPEFKSIDEADFDDQSPRLLRKWGRVCCVLYNLRASREGDTPTVGGFDATCYDENFFAEYEDDYEEIKLLHRSLAPSIERYKQTRAASPDDDPGAAEDAINKDIDALTTKLYSFIACAVRSRQSDEAGVATALNALGFRLPGPQPVPVDWFGIILVVFFAALLSLAGAWVIGWYFERFPESVVEQLRYIPQDPVKRILWPVSTFLYLFSAIGVARLYRRAQVRRAAWTHWQGDEIERPYLKYIVAGLLGALASYLVLVVMGMAARAIEWDATRSAGTWSVVSEVLLLSLIWMLVSGIAAARAVYYRDTAAPQISPWRRIYFVGVDAASMGFAAFISTELYTFLWLQYHPIDGGSADIVDSLNRHYGVLIAILVGLMGALIGFFLPRRQLHRARQAAPWIGTWRTCESDGTSHSITLKPGGRAVTDLYPQGEGDWWLGDDRSEVRIAWSSGWTDVLERRGDRHCKVGYRTGTSPYADPTHIDEIQRAANAGLRE